MPWRADRDRAAYGALYKIARRYNIGLRSLIDANDETAIHYLSRTET